MKPKKAIKPVKAWAVVSYGEIAQRLYCDWGEELAIYPSEELAKSHKWLGSRVIPIKITPLK